MSLAVAVALIVALAAGIFIAIRFRGRRRKRLLAVIAAGAFLCGFAFLWNDYSWFERSIGTLPPEADIVDTRNYSGRERPWTLFKPRVERFAAVDDATIERDGAHPGFAIADVFFVQRNQPTLRARQIFDCRSLRRADMTNEAVFENGDFRGVVWVSLEEDDPVFVKACGRRSRT